MSIDLTSWMDLVKGSKLLSELSIPGTHDSGAKDPAETGDEKTRLTTQTRTIGEQLEDGIRFLDIRIKYINNAFAVYHEDTSLNLDFETVRTTCRDFLALHPRETIIMSIKQESSNSGITNGLTFQERFQAYVDLAKDLWFLENRIPKLSEVRGKIVLFRRFPLDRNATTAPGINAKDGFDAHENETFTIEGPPRLEIQDGFRVLFDSNKEGKFNNVRALLDRASTVNAPDTLFINFASGAGTLGDTENVFPIGVSEFVNPRLIRYFSEAAHQQGRFGVLLTDFETTQLNTLIIRTNLLLDGGYWIAQLSGTVTAFGSARDFTSDRSPKRAIAIAATPSGNGFYLLDPDKKVYFFGDATDRGSGGPDAQAISITARPDSVQPAGAGYWILYTSGQVRAFNANNHGSLGEGTNLHPVSIVATPDGLGYWILTSNGKIHNFGSAGHFSDRRDGGQVTTAMAATPDGGGYWILSSNGAVHAFGNAVHHGQGVKKGAYAQGIAATRDGAGYWILTTDGDITPYGSAQYFGRVRHTPAAVGIAADPRPAAPGGATATTPAAAAQATAAVGAPA